jgi:hypothetical protein
MFFTYSQTKPQNQTITKPQTVPKDSQKPETNIFIDNLTQYQMQANMLGRINFGIPCKGCKK